MAGDGVYLMVVMIESILGIEEGDDAVADVGQKLVKLVLSIEPVPLVEGGIVVAHVLEDLLVEVVPQGRDQEHHAAHKPERFQQFAHAAY
jgi:hypothetical protein